MTDDIVKRLRGEYPVGPIVNGEPEFGWCKFDGLPPIQAEAADEIERLRAELMAVCQREAASAVRHDAKLDALEHEIRNLTNRIEQLRDARAQVARLRNVASEAYWLLAYDWQSHLFDKPSPFNTDIFSPEARVMMTASELALLKTLDALKETER